MNVASGWWSGASEICQADSKISRGSFSFLSHARDEDEANIFCGRARHPSVLEKGGRAI
jgi:hypothetical protein